MTSGDLIAALDSVAEAPDGVERLRELVLELAVRGRLVPQDPADEPASILLERISTERARLLSTAMIRKQQLLPAVSENEIPSDLPSGWEWTRFGAITDTRLGKMLDKAKNKGPLRSYLRNANVQWFRFVLGDMKELRIEEEQLADCSVSAGDLVICEGGEPGRVAVCGPETDGMVVQKALHRSRPWCGISSWYLAYLLRCEASSGRLSERFTGATIKHLTGQSLAKVVVPLPPLPEQHRIVARVGELMGLLNRLEATRTTRDATRAAVRDSTLDALREADTPERVELAWNRLADRMGDLLCDPADIAPLRQAVLQLAVRGRLISQDPAEGPASMLLERIAAEKARLLKAGRIPKQEPLLPVREDEIPFGVPEAWCWTRFDYVADTRLGKMLDKAKNQGPLRPYLRNANVQWFRFVLDDVRKLRVEDDQLSDCTVRAGDLVICEGGEPGRASVCGPEVDGMVIQKALHRSRPWCGISAWFLAYLLRCEASSGRLAEHFTGATIKHLTGKALAQYVVPLPPLAEQHRIVARVDALMGLLDRLEGRLVAARTAHVAFAAAAVHHLDA